MIFVEQNENTAEDAQMAWALEDSRRDWEKQELVDQQENVELNMALEYSRINSSPARHT